MNIIKLSLVVVLGCSLAASAIAKVRTHIPLQSQPAATAIPSHLTEPLYDYPPVPSSALSNAPTPATDEVDSVVATVGSTWFDYFSNGNTNRLIARDNTRGLHICWTKSDNGGTGRNVYYNYRMPDSIWYNNTGLAVFANPVATAPPGYCDMDVLSNGIAVVAAHRGGTTVPNHSYTSVIGKDDDYQVGAFTEYTAAYPATSTAADSFIWPAVVVDKSNRAHVFAMDRSSGVFGHRFFYTRSDSGISSFPAWSYHNMRTGTIGIYTATTRTDTNRVVAAWSQCMRGYDNIGRISQGSAQAENDLYYVISNDGGNTWNWDNPVNVTRFRGWSDTIFANTGDTLLAGRDTFRCYNDCAAIFDNQNVLHLFFVTQGIYDRPSTNGDSVVAYYAFSASELWHWCESRPDQYDWVANGWWRFMGNQNGTTSTAQLAWQKSLSRPSAAIGTNGTLYCIWTQFDPGDYAANGLPCGDIYASKSVDGGQHWYFPTNLTNTGNDSTTASGQAHNEMFASCQEVVNNDTLYVMYVDRRDGGVAVNPYMGTTPAWTNNPIKVMSVPVNSIRADSVLHLLDSLRYGQSIQLHAATVSVPHEAAAATPKDFRIVGNYPNPFNPTTDIVFSLDKARNIQLAVYDINGREVTRLANGEFGSGRHTVSFDGRKLASGIYFAQLTSDGLSHSIKLTLLK